MQEDRDLTRNVIIDCGFDWSAISIATPFKGSKLYDICIENKYSSEAELLNPNAYRCVIKAPGIDPEEITKEAIQNEFGCKFR